MKNMKNMFDFYQKNYDKITILTFAFLLITVLLAIIIPLLIYVVVGIIYLLMLITLCNVIIFYKEMSIDIFEKMKF
jgi:fatty acid desaturase